MLKKVLFLLLLCASFAYADTEWATRYNSWTRQPDWYKNSVTSATYSNEALALVGYVMAKEYGVVGDGVTDDTAALQAAIDACGATKTLILPDGTFKVNSTSGTYALHASCSIVGTAPKNCIIYNAGTGSAIDFTGAGYYSTWQNFQVKGSTSSEDGITTCSRSDMSYATAYSSFRNVWSRYHGRNGLVHRMAWGTRYDDCKFDYNEGLGVYAVRTGTDTAGASALSFINCDARWNGGTGDETNSFTKGGVKFVGNVSTTWFRGVVESNNAWDFIISSQTARFVEQVRIDGVHMEDTPRSDSLTTTGGHIFASGDWENVSVENCWVSYGAKAGSTGYGMYITATSTTPVHYPAKERLFFDKNNWMAPTGAGTHILEYMDNNFIRNPHYNTDRIDFSTGATTVDKIGRLNWNDTDTTLNLKLNDDVTLQIGEETLIKVVNKTGYDIPDGSLVDIIGSQGQRPTVGLALAVSTGACECSGITTQAILNNQEGFVTVRGLVRGLNTDRLGAVEGDRVYLSTTTAGDWQINRPDAPYCNVFVGIITNVHLNQGSILVNPRPSRDLKSLDDVNGTPLTTTGQFPVWDNSRQVFDFNYKTNTRYIVVTATTSSEIQSIINNNGDNYTYQFVAGTISVNSQIKIFKNNITLEGQGFSTVFLADAWANWATPNDLFYSSGTSGLTFKNLKIDGLAANTGQSKSLIKIQSSAYLTIQNVWLDYSDYHGMYIEGSNYVFVDHNIITNTDNYGIYYYGYDNIKAAYSGGYQTITTNNEIRVCQSGITVQYCRASIASQNYIWGATGWGIQSDQNNFGFELVGNVIFGGTGGGIYFYGTGTNGFNCTGQLISSAGVGILVQGGIQAGSLTNNAISITGTNHGIEIGTYSPVSNINVIGNSIVDAGNGKASIYAADLSNSLIAFNNCSNTATGKSEQAFRLLVGTGNVISNNVCKNQDTADIQIDAGCINNQVTNNICYDGVKVIDNGTNTCLFVVQDCKFGIGRSSPTYTLDVAGTMWVGTSTVSGSSFEQDGTIVFNGNATIWDDLQVILNPATAIYAPTYTDYKAGRVLVFSDEPVNADRIHFIAQIPHSYKLGSTIYPHVHWVGEDNTAGDVAWKIDYSTAAVMQSFTATTSSTTYTANSTTTDYHNLTSLAPITGNRGISGIILGTISRDSTDAGDTYNGKNVYLLQFDIHYEKDTEGSRTELTK